MDYIRQCRAQSNDVTSVYISDEHFFFKILLSVALVIFVLELSSKQQK